MKYADEVDARFGIPWMPELKYERGELQMGLSRDEARMLMEKSPDKAKFLLELKENQPTQEELDPIQWGFSLPSWERVMDRWEKDKVHVIFGVA